MENDPCERELIKALSGSGALEERALVSGRVGGLLGTHISLITYFLHLFIGCPGNGLVVSRSGRRDSLGRATIVCGGCGREQSVPLDSLPDGLPINLESLQQLAIHCLRLENYTDHKQMCSLQDDGVECCCDLDLLLEEVRRLRREVYKWVG